VDELATSPVRAIAFQTKLGARFGFVLYRYGFLGSQFFLPMSETALNEIRVTM
jgi:hypothetical protein